ncbi:flippase activity-associated protein Agl23 [Chloroflexus aggregans]|nr:flippase activity-associated protein Agl23 [Chloroflexus aggregans]
MAVQTLTTETVLDRRLRAGWLRWETALYTLIVIASVLAHLWGLERMALHHDESIHAWSSWRLYSGAGSFSCWNGLDENGNARGGLFHETYCYDPVYHGPSLYFLTALIYFLFGDGDAQARLPMALAGIGLVMSAWWLRPYLGRAGALIAAVLLGFSPSLLYYTRFARHDGLMVLWELWMVIGALRWIDSGQRQWLYLTAVGLALAIATHELYYILLFIFGVFVLMRLLAESRFARYQNIVLPVIIGICVVLMIVNPPLPFGRGLYIGEKAFLVASALTLAWLCQRLWPPEPILIPRLQHLWRSERSVLWTALAVLGGIYLVLFTSFFTYLPGAIDGISAGLIYWLGSQQEYARGDQPWYYYLILLPLYEPLAVLSGIGVVVAMIVAVVRRWRAGRTVPPPVADAATSDMDDVDVAARLNVAKPWPLYPLLVVFWFFTAIIIFSWAGEKMPWLVTHMALPGNLLAAWVISRLSDMIQREQTSARIWLVPLLVILLLVAVGVTFWRLGSGGTTAFLQAIVPLAIVFGLIYALLTLIGQLGIRRTSAAIGLTVAALLAMYTIRATWLVVYDHPDVPVEPLIYTQTAPDVPRYAADIRDLAINLTRGNRSPQDTTGGLTMPIILDGGDRTAEGSLAWPLQWYLRDFKSIVWVNGSELGRVPSVEQLTVTMPDGSRDLAPMVMLYRPYVTDRLRNILRESYVQPYGTAGVFNWWFPEGNKCAPQSPGYKKFYYSTWSAAAAQAACGRDLSGELHGPFDVLLWPLQRENWPALGRYLLFRQLPDPLVPGAREVEVWLRRDLAGGVGQTMTATTTPTLRLAALAEIRLSSGGNGATGIAFDRQGNIYVADTLNHRIEVFAADGTPIRTIGTQGNALDQFYEPRGLAFDAQGNLYVADTWNARIVKYSPDLRPMTSWGGGDLDLGDGRRATITEGDPARNAAAPLGFFGPRGVAVDAAGNVYIADTGNKRIVVTDSNGTFLYQFGGAGSAPGQFNEPTSLAFDAAGNLYVADTWNGRVQVFTRTADGRIDPTPLTTWPVAGWQPNTYDDPMLAVSPDGMVYVAVPARQYILVASTGGEALLQWTGFGRDGVPITSPSGLAVATNGSIWVVDRLGGRAARFALPALAPTQP